METNNNLDEVTYYENQINLPNSTGVLVCGILAIPFAGLIGLILAIVSLSMASTATNLYNQNPGKYTESSIKNVRAGKICAIIGICLIPLSIIAVIAMQA